MPRVLHDAHPRDETVERLELQLHADREGLIVQVRALATAIDHLAAAIELHEVEETSTDVVRDHVEQARLALASIW